MDQDGKRYKRRE
jgi:NAD(P)H-flavin reductase